MIDVNIIYRLKRALALTVVFILLTSCAQNGQPASSTSGGPLKQVVFSDAWEHVQSAGRIVVGITANQVPFALYNENLVLDGFNVAVMREVGRRLGVQVEFRDYTSEGLAQGIRSGQIDAAVLNTSAVDTASLLLSNSFYVDSDALLVLASSPIGVIQTPSELAQKRVGVLRNGSFQSVVSQWVPADHLTLLARNEDAVAELQSGHIDLAVLDLASAEILSGRSAVRIIGQGLFPIRLAMAMRKDSRLLANQIDAALSGMLQQSLMTQLSLQYLSIDKVAIQPLPDPQISAALQDAATPLPESACATGMAFVQNLSLDDQNMSDIPAVQPGQIFTKTWRVQNNGTCPWYLSYRLIYEYGNVAGARMNGNVFNIIRETQPGTLIDLQVTLTAPPKPGVYRGVWQMIDGRGKPFGERLYAVVRVPIVAFPPANPSGKEGKLVIGADMNNRPFAYYTDINQLDGFDIAVLREIGRKLNLTVEFHDYPVEGLAQAIQSNQIDVAVVNAGADATGLLGYSNIYYRGEGNIVTADNAPLSKSLSLTDVLKLRVGVLTGSVYYYLLSRQMAASNLTQFPSTNALLDAIRTRRIDVGVMDLGNVGTLINQGLRVAARGVFQRHMAIGFRKGNVLFETQLNTILSALNTDDRINHLAVQYLNIDRTAILPILDTNASRIEAKATVSDCLSGMVFVATAGFDENNPNVISTVLPGIPFLRNWRVQNTGTCEWTPGYRLVYAYGNTPAAIMGGKGMTLTRQVLPGETADLQLQLVSPIAQGTYRSVWQMVDAKGRPFGERLYTNVSN